MSDEIQIDSNVRELLKAWAALPDKLRAGVKAGLARGLLLVEDRVRSQTKVKWRRGASGLSGRLTSFVEQVSGGIAVDGLIGFRRRRGFPYELAQEFGAKARAGGAMAMPVSAAAKRLSDRGGSPREFPEPLFIPPHMNVLATAYKRGGGLKAIHYVLLKSIPPRLGFRKAVLGSADVINREVASAALGAA